MKWGGRMQFPSLLGLLAKIKVTNLFMLQAKERELEKLRADYANLKKRERCLVTNLSKKLEERDVEVTQLQVAQSKLLEDMNTKDALLDTKIQKNAKLTRRLANMKTQKFFENWGKADI
jgi:hypothetical protein